MIHTPYAAPRANAICERFVGSARRECLDHMLIFGERQLGRVLGGYKEYLNEARPHQRLGQRIPVTVGLPLREVQTAERIMATPVLNGLHHDYRQVVDGPPDGAVIA